MGHTVGLWHEQSRADRDTYVVVNYKNMIKAEGFRSDILQDDAQNLTTYYDYASVMQYFSTTFTRNGGFTFDSIPSGIPLANTNDYTPADIEGIERLYGAPPSSITVTTNPPGLPIIVDGTSYTAPQTFNWALNSTHTLNFPNPEQPYSYYTRYAFNNWNLNGTTNTNASVSLTSLPNTSASYVANVTPQFLPATNWGDGLPPFMPCGTTTLPTISPASPTGDGFYPAGQLLTFSTTPASPWTFAGWTYDLTGIANPANLTLNDEALVYANFNTLAAPLTITGISPTSAVAGGPTFTLTITGTGFSSSTQVILVKNPGPNSTASFPATTLVSSTTLQATITSADITTPGAMQIWLNVFPSGWTGNCSVFALNTFLVANNSNPGTPTITTTPSSLSFSAQAVGTTGSSKSVMLNNTGTGGTAITFAASGDFAETDTCGGFVTPGGSCTVNVTFIPTVSGAISGVLTLKDGASNSPQLVNLTGTGTLPLSISPASLSFGTVTVGSTSPAKTVTLTNKQGSALSISFAASGDYAAVGSGTLPCGASLAAGGNCTISVTFKPTASGSINGGVTIRHNATFSPQNVVLSGTGSGGAASPLTFSPATVAFAATGVGATSPAKVITVTNSSASSVTINGISATGNFAAVGSGAASCGGILLAGSKCTVSVTFSPSIDGTIKGAVVISDSSAVSPQVLNATGTAVLPVTFSPASLTFAAQTVGTTSVPKLVTLTNNSGSALSIAIAASGDYSAVPAGSTPCGATVIAGGKCTFNVTFTAGAVGPIKGYVTVTHGAPTSPQVMSLTGTGQ